MKKITHIIRKSYSMECSHWLPLVADGHKCKKMHGHSYILTFELSSETLVKGMVCDFGDVSRVVKGVITGVLDHTVLNDHIENPTAENIAVFVADTFCHEFRMNYYRPNHPWHKDRKIQKIKLRAVEVQETATSSSRLELDKYL